VDVKPLPGLEHLPYAEVWLRSADEGAWREASRLARELGKDGLEVWTTDASPEVVSFLEPRGYEVVRRYVVSELDVGEAPDPEPPGVPLTTLALRPHLAPQVYEIACESYPDQPGRAEQRMPPYDGWRSWGLDPHPPEAFFIALEGDRPLAYGYLHVEGDRGQHGFTAVARSARGRGLAGAIKRAQIVWAKANGLATLRTANEVRLPQMLALNERHGYRRVYTELVLRGPAAA
jgi:GNAT superfamily N-acetyltransferase